jgi:hypothetical protein
VRESDIRRKRDFKLLFRFRILFCLHQNGHLKSSAWWWMSRH